MVTSLSGTMSTKLDKTVSVVISTKQEVDKMAKKMKEIKQLNIPVVSEGNKIGALTVSTNVAHNLLYH